MSNMTDALEEYQRRVEAGEIEREPAKNHIQKWRVKNTRATAINAFCCHCMGGTEEDMADIRRLVRECTSKNCHLYQWRPYK